MNTSTTPQPLQTGLLFDAERQLWIAAHPDTVQALLHHPGLRVRPVAEPVPKALVGGPAGAMFGRWLRMSDGAAHQAGKPALQAALQRWTDEHQIELRALVQTTAARRLPFGWADWMWVTPASSMAQMLGITAERADALTPLLRALAKGFAPAADDAATLAAHEVALALQDLIAAAPPSSLLRAIQAEGWNDAAALHANLVGLIWQSFEATAALLGNGLVALARDAELARRMRERDADWAALLRQVCRSDAPIQQTRRFAPQPMDVAGTELPAGACIIVVLSGAGTSTFGDGPHACPGQDLALLIARSALQQALHSGMAWPITDDLRYEPAANLRAPIFADHKVTT
ncbi:MAG: cytochrome P450 [Burkholderiaceae bacterium]|nr:cytochrome P450 [Burkholderiaceae bacterium]